MKPLEEENTYNGIIGDELYSKAETTVLRLGINPSKNGYTYLTEASALYSTDCAVPIRRIYETVASFHGVKPRTVMRGITYAIEQSHELHKRLSQMINVQVTLNELRSGLVIAYLAKILNPKINPPIEQIKSHYTDQRQRRTLASPPEI